MRSFFSIQVKRGESYNFILTDLDVAAEMYLVSATLGFYNSTDYLHFVAKKKIEQNNKKRNEKEKGKRA